MESKTSKTLCDHISDDMIGIKVQITDGRVGLVHTNTITVTKQLVLDLTESEENQGCEFMRQMIDAMGEQLNEAFKKIMGRE